MKLNICTSVFHSQNIAYGNISGQIEAEFIPAKDDFVSFIFPLFPCAPLLIPGFSGLLKVQDRIFVAGNNQYITVNFSSISVSTEADAVQVMQYFEKAFGLTADIY